MFAYINDFCTFRVQTKKMKAILHNRVMQHVFFWCFQLLIYTGNYTKDGNYMVGLVTTLFYLPTHLLFTYTQLYLFIPRLLLKKKFAAYIIVSLLVTHILYCLNVLYYSFIIYPIMFEKACTFFAWKLMWTFNQTELKAAFSYFMICSMAAAVKLLKKWYYEHNRNQIIEKEKLSIELEMLKAQVHPHFLFNTLNNLYSLTLTRSDKAPVTVSHLSDLLRYMLYECNEKEVPLEKEIEVLKKYIELEKLRYGNRLDVSFSYSGNIRQLKIAPLILLPFVENSFKHGVSEEIDKCWISLQMHAQDNTFNFILSNSRSLDALKNKPGGIGLQNIKKRLNLIYPGSYSLTINEAAEMYGIKLQIQLSTLPQVMFTPKPSFVVQPIPAIV